MESITYLALEYLTCLLLAFAAGVALFVCAVMVLAAGSVGRSVTGRWGMTVGPRLQDARQHLPVTTKELAIRLGRAALVTAHSAPSTSFAGRKQG
jgi:hypothetical protein